MPYGMTKSRSGLWAPSSFRSTLSTRRSSFLLKGSSIACRAIRLEFRHAEILKPRDSVPTRFGLPPLHSARHDEAAVGRVLLVKELPRLHVEEGVGGGDSAPPRLD